jgi:tRNA (guanine37-N1)-methyltransferase
LPEKFVSIPDTPAGQFPGWAATILTLFPEMFPGPLHYSLSGKALQKNIWSMDTVHLRDFASGVHQGVDDTCYGGGAGMIIRADIIDAALKQVTKDNASPARPLIYLTPRGTPLNQKMIERYVQDCAGVVLLCGRYEGVDQRVVENWHMEEVSIGDFVLSGGETAALSLLDACIRLLPGVMGKKESSTEESFELGLLEYPQYTRPQVWRNHKVPDVLLSGNHKNIADWRRQEAEKITQIRRPDLWSRYLENIGK